MKKNKQFVFVVVLVLAFMTIFSCNKQKQNKLIGVWEAMVYDYVLKVISDDTAVLVDSELFVYKYDERDDGFITIYFYDAEGYEYKAWYDGSAIVF